MSPREWLLTVREDLLALEIRKDIPCLFSGAQMVHEAFNGTGTMSGLAASHNNFCGMKAASSWQQQFGGGVVTLPTQEYIAGEWVTVAADFATFPSWQAWLDAYAYLLTNPAWSYSQALAYKAYAALYAREIYRTWATDPNAANAVQDWMISLYDLLGPEFTRRPVEITVYGEPLAHGWLEGATAVAPVRELTLPGWRRVWNPATGVRPAQIDLTLDILPHE